MRKLKIICKITGKILTYFGMIFAIVSTIPPYPQGLLGFGVGVTCIGVGCLIHELSEL